jgi:tetratricopeptide (TPR) repeat protein
MDAVLQQATTLHNQGRLDEAERLYLSVLKTDPGQADALALLGILQGARRAYSEAIWCLEHAIRIDPAAALFRFYLGNILNDMCDYQGAAAAFEEALARKPDFAEAHGGLAYALERLNRRPEAVTHLREAVRIKPDNGAAWVALSEAAFKESDYELAGAAAAEAVRLMPDDLAAHIAHGMALDFLNREEEAILSFKEAVRIKPDFVEAWDMLGAIYQGLCRLDEAETVMRKAIEVAGCAIADEIGREVAEEEYGVQHWNLGLLELLRGDYRKGFAHYRARFKKPGGLRRLPVPRAIWRSEDIRGKKILVVGEQGFGDVLMLCRYLPLLKAEGAHVVLLVHAALAPLLRKGNIADEILCEAPEAQGDFDFQTSLFDLPYRFGTVLETIPASVPYLPLPPADDATRLPDEGVPRIGVVWAGRQDHGNDRRRSLPLAVLADLFHESGFRFFNLTRDLKPGDAEILARPSVTDFAPRLGDFLATARFINQLDLVIACDTAVAHLAGGMGKKTWVLLPFVPDWRWLLAREDSPWYPSMRLFRQRQKADWAEVILRIREELKKSRGKVF